MPSYASAAPEEAEGHEAGDDGQPVGDEPVGEHRRDRRAGGRPGGREPGGEGTLQRAETAGGNRHRAYGGPTEEDGDDGGETQTDSEGPGGGRQGEGITQSDARRSAEQGSGGRGAAQNAEQRRGGGAERLGESRDEQSGPPHEPGADQH